ncbi:MAG: anthranilate synthase component 1 [Saprospiraceae bacterium]|jgi:anthranilate synthase component 1
MITASLHQPVQKVKIQTTVKRLLADTYTPVSIYLKLRDHFGSSVLLESTDFRSMENCFSFIGLDPIATFQVQNNIIKTAMSGHPEETTGVTKPNQVVEMFNDYLQQFEVESPPDYKGINGFFGHTGFDAVQYFDTLQFDSSKRKTDLPDINYSLYRFVIAINHFKDELHIIENKFPGEASRVSNVEDLISSNSFGVYHFELEGKEETNLTDDEFRALVTAGKKHCQVGDVFQLVLSRKYSQKFRGDEFNVYRILRSVNPSPYLFYFDYGNYKIFGSSPEAQMVIKGNIASVNPIAGTYRRTGDDEQDRKNAQALAADPKENAEHIMLVDLARNDLGKHSKRVYVKDLKDIQFFSHVIHLVSNVEGEISPEANRIQLFGDTFPAGTLSGAPKYKALELINKYEKENRSFYGGAIGYIGFKGEMNQAIVIRSFLSKENTLHYQAGAGIVAASVEENELQEVNIKLGALKKALKEAEKL